MQEVNTVSGLPIDTGEEGVAERETQARVTDL